MHVSETYGAGSTEPTEYTVTNAGLYINKQRRRVRSVVDTLKDVFLPQGYPDSVSSDYAAYQCWDTVQAFCSSVTGALAGRAVMHSYGVGDKSASVLAATLMWLLRNGSGMLGGILFTWAKGAALDYDCKRYRLLADFVNDAAILLQLLSPSFGQPNSPGMTAALCLSSVLMAIVGVCGGSTRAALTMHQARRNNMADVSAKDGSQETLVNLAALLFNLLLVQVLPSGLATILAYFLFTSCHLAANWLAVRSVVMETLNPSRLHNVVASYVDSGFVSCCSVAVGNRGESLLPSMAQPRATRPAPATLGCSLALVARRVAPHALAAGVARQREAGFAVFCRPDSEEMLVTLGDGCDDSTQLLAAFHCELLHLCRLRPQLIGRLLASGEPSPPLLANCGTEEERVDWLAGVHFDRFRRLAEQSGWATNRCALGALQFRVAVSKAE